MNQQDPALDRQGIASGVAYDLFSKEFKTDPFPTYSRMRDEAPIFAHRAPDANTIWYITRYRDVLAVLQDNEHFCKDPRNAKPFNKPVRRTMVHRLINENMLFSDPPDHTRLRALVSQAFTPQRIDELSGFILSVANRLVDRFQGEREVNLMSSFALPLPVYVISRLLGIPSGDRNKVAHWSQAIISPGSQNLNYSERKHRVRALTRYLSQMFILKQADPQDDLISALVHAEASGERLSETELSSMVVLLLVTGHETTVNLIGNGALALLQHPDQLALLHADDTLWEIAIEELLRYDGPVETSTSRWARKDICLGGQLIRRGDLVRVVLASANRDDEQFEAPNDLLITRSENKHLAFGYGIHYCLGAPLARLEARIALQTLFKRLPVLRLKLPANQLRWRAGVLFRGLQELEIRWNK